MPEEFPITASNHMTLNDVRKALYTLPESRHLGLDKDIHKAITKVMSEYRDNIVKEEREEHRWRIMQQIKQEEMDPISQKEIEDTGKNINGHNRCVVS